VKYVFKYLVSLPTELQCYTLTIKQSPSWFDFPDK